MSWAGEGGANLRRLRKNPDHYYPSGKFPEGLKAITGTSGKPKSTRK
jgi:hypothetical protein